MASHEKRSQPMKPRLVYITTDSVSLRLFLRGQIAYAKAAGFEVMAVAAPGPHLDRVRQRDEIDVYPIPFVRHISPLDDIRAFFALLRLLRRLRPDIVHASTSKAGPLAMAAAFLAHVPIRVYLLRGVMIDRKTGLRKTILKIMEWIGCRSAIRVLAVSPSVRDVMLKAGLCDADKMAVLAKGSSNGVDAVGRFNPDKVNQGHLLALRKRLRLSPHMPVIGFVGRMVGGKGIDKLLDVWRVIRAGYHLSRLVLIGAPESQDPVGSSVMAHLVRDNRVAILDFVPNDELPLYYSIATVIAFPTKSEGFPNVPLEAAAMEKPVVATSVTGCVDAVVHNVTGMLVPLGDVEAMVAALRLYLDNPNLRRRHGRAARTRVLRDFRPDTVWQANIDEYRRLLAANGIQLEAEEGNASASTG